MKYAGLKYNDIVDTENGICVSFWTQGCPHHCPGCHNPETWDFDGGIELPDNIYDTIIHAISAHGIQRNFSVLGGEPLCKENLQLVHEVLTAVKTAYPSIKTYLWTGYTYEELLKRNDDLTKATLSLIDVLIDGRFDISKKDITLRLRGSSNQKIIYKNNL